MGPLSAGELRRELSARNLLFAEDVPHESTYGTVPSVVYYEIDGAHGNFLLASYRRICASAEWSRRLKKCYAASRRLPRPGDRIRRELDCVNSSDALLMNIFCYPGVTRRKPQNLLDGREPPLALSSARDNPVCHVSEETGGGCIKAATADGDLSGSPGYGGGQQRRARLARSGHRACDRQGFFGRKRQRKYTVDG